MRTVPVNVWDANESAADQVTISRRAGGPIQLDEWMRYVASSTMLRPVAAREGINPFTKQSTMFRPPAGAATLSTAAGDCSIEYRDGALIVRGPVDDAISVLNEIANALNGSVKKGY